MVTGLRLSPGKQTNYSFCCYAFFRAKLFTLFGERNRINDGVNRFNIFFVSIEQHEKNRDPG